MKYVIDQQLNIVPYKKQRTVLWLIPIVILIGVIIYMRINHIGIKETIVYKTITKSSEPQPDVPLTEEGLTATLHKYGCVLPNIAVAQAKLESQLGKSNIGREAKNLFGIMHHKCQYVTGKYGLFATYNSYEDNIKCYIHIQDHYLKRIDGVYAEPGYSDLIRKMK